MCREFKLPKWPKPGHSGRERPGVGHLDQRIHGAPRRATTDGVDGVSRRQVNRRRPKQEAS